VRRSWTATADEFVSTTRLSPYPDATLTRLQPGTLEIRWRVSRPARAAHAPPSPDRPELPAIARRFRAVRAARPIPAGGL
jgi:hypothetical protein